LHNKFRRWIRRKRPRLISLDRPGGEEGSEGIEDLAVADQPDPGEKAELSEATQHVRNAIDELSPDHRLIITMRYVEGLSYREIAAVVGCPIGTVKSRIHYALDKIGGKLAGLGLGPP
jgi:RNA polymerase sigma-70 factor (ECF subfamily)